MIIQILGAKGMLGSEVAREAARRGYQIVLEDVEITNVTPERIRAETVINCAGIVKQRSVSNARFVQVNSYGPQLLAEACDSRGARLIHVSSDCVFSHPGPHDEDDCPSGSDIYAVSKRAGEITRTPHVTLRTSFVGWGPRGLIHDILAGKPLRASKNLLWSGHTTPTVAEILVNLAERQDIQGLLHTPGTFQSRYELSTTLVQWLGLNTEIIEDNTFIQDRRLVSRRWYNLGLLIPPPFLTQLNKLQRQEHAI